MKEEKFYNDLEKKFKALPQYRLSNETRSKIYSAIRNEMESPPQKTNKRMSSLLIASCIPLIIGVFALFLTMDHTNSRTPTSETKEVHTRPIAHSPSGVVFHNSDGYELFGIPSKIGLLNVDWVAESYNASKMMVYIWDHEKRYENAQISVKAVHTENQLEIDLDANGTENQLGGPMGGADYTLMTSYKSFPYPGIWNLYYELDGEDFAEFSIHVKEPYPKNESITILRSPEDFVINDNEEVYLERFVSSESFPREFDIHVQSLDSGERFIATFISDGNYSTRDGRKVADFVGHLNFPIAGRWELITGTQGRIIIDVND